MKLVPIVQIESKLLSKADRIKKLNYENKYLFGAKIKKEKLAKNEFKKETQPLIEDIKKPKNLTSEIYWRCLHIPEVLDFTKPTKKTKPKAKTSVKKSKAIKTLDDDDGYEPEPLPIKIVPKKAAPKTIVKKPELPDSLNMLHKALPEVKNKIKDSLSESFKLRVLEQEDVHDQREIPFEVQQLRAITGFPMTLSNTKNDCVKTFVKTDGVSYLPSVSKVLQGTMPELQRNALINWKNLKISELGLEGFEIMQQCKNEFTTLEVFKIF